MFVFIIEIATALCESKTYYVNATGGSDSNNGSCSESAWKTIAKINAGHFNPGDTIKLARGEVWREKLQFPSDGNSSDYLTLMDYGPETVAKPKILCSQTKNTDSRINWTNISTNVWQSGSFSAYGSAYSIGFILFNGEVENPVWGIDTAKFVTNLTELSEEGQLWWDAYPDSRMVLYTTNTSGPNVRWPNMEVGVLDRGIELSGKSYIKIKNIDVRYGTGGSFHITQNKTGTKNTPSHHVILDSVEASWGGGTITAIASIRAGDIIKIDTGTYNLTLKSSNSSYAWEACMSAEGWQMNDSGYNILFENNTLNHCGMRIAVNAPYYGINSSMMNITIRNNSIYKTGHSWSPVNYSYHGAAIWAYRDEINQNNTFNITIEDNLIDTFTGTGIYLQDGGPYTVRRNIIRNGEGTYNSSVQPEAILIHGISVTYNGDIWGEIYQNLIYNNTRGVFMINNVPRRPVKFINNVFANNTRNNYSSFEIGGSSNNTNLTNNIFYEYNNTVLKTPATTKLFTADYNLYYWGLGNLIAYGTTITSNVGTYRGTLGVDAHSIFNQSPQFTHPLINFTLQATSPAISNGTDVGLTADILGNVIPLGDGPEMGAYEYINCTDADTDGYLDSTCGGDDCNDTNSSINPGATEICNFIDDDCDSSIDEGLLLTFYKDYDNDSYGNATNFIQNCTVSLGYTTNNTDCNDNNSLEYPGQTWYSDLDNDKFGNGTLITQCARLPFYNTSSELISTTTDCNNSNSSINTIATEFCNFVDDNCNGSIDEGVTTTFYKDYDNDTFGNNTNYIQNCSISYGYVTNNTDCNDYDILQKPGQVWYLDYDSDKYGNGTLIIQCSRPNYYNVSAELTSTSGDCNDTNINVNPNQTEECNGIDDNCNGQIDEGVENTYYLDYDEDLYGNLTNTTLSCIQPSGYVTDSMDCDDNNLNINPGKDEICGDGIDQNCDDIDLQCEISSMKIRNNYQRNVTIFQSNGNIISVGNITADWVFANGINVNVTTVTSSDVTANITQLRLNASYSQNNISLLWQSLNQGSSQLRANDAQMNNSINTINNTVGMLWIGLGIVTVNISTLNNSLNRVWSGLGLATTNITDLRNNISQLRNNNIQINNSINTLNYSLINLKYNTTTELIIAVNSTGYLINWTQFSSNSYNTTEQMITAVNSTGYLINWSLFITSSTASDVTVNITDLRVNISELKSFSSLTSSNMSSLNNSITQLWNSFGNANSQLRANDAQMNNSINTLNESLTNLKYNSTEEMIMAVNSTGYIINWSQFLSASETASDVTANITELKINASDAKNNITQLWLSFTTTSNQLRANDAQINNSVNTLNTSTMKLFGGNTIRGNQDFLNNVLFYGETYFFNSTYLSVAGILYVNESTVWKDISGTPKITINASNNQKLWIDGNANVTGMWINNKIACHSGNNCGIANGTQADVTANITDIRTNISMLITGATNNFTYLNRTTNQWNSTSTALYPSILSKNVGINTSNPYAALDVQSVIRTTRFGYDNVQYIQFNEDANGHQILANSQVNNDKAFFIDLKSNSANASVNTNIQFRLGNSSGVLTRMIINSYGYVGIGATSPITLLDVYTPSTVDSDATWPNNISMGDADLWVRRNNQGIEFGTTGLQNDRNSWILARHTSTAQYGGYMSTLHIQPALGDDSKYMGIAIGYNSSVNLVANGARLAVNGSVGIGTTTPTDALSVIGVINATTGIEAGMNSNGAYGIIAGKGALVGVTGRNDLKTVEGHLGYANYGVYGIQGDGDYAGYFTGNSLVDGDLSVTNLTVSNGKIYFNSTSSSLIISVT